MNKSDLITQIQSRNPDQEFLNELRAQLDDELKKPVSEQNYDLINELTEGIAVLTGTDALIEEKAQEGIRRLRAKAHKRKHKLRLKIPAVIAAAVAVIAGTVIGVFAYVRYNKEMVKFEFGTLGEARAAECISPQPMTRDNGEIAVTVENVLSDGVQAMLLLTLDPANKNMAYDWTAFDEDYGNFMHNQFLIDGQTIESHIATGFHPDAYEYMTENNQRWLVMFFPLPEDVSQDALSRAVYNCVPDASGNPEAQISFSVDLRKNVDAITMRSEDGQELLLSAFEVYMNGYQSSHTDWWNMYITWKSGKEQRITHGNFAGSDQREGDQAVTWGQFAVPVDAVIDGNSKTGDIQFHSPEDWYGFIEVKEVAAFRFGDKVFYPVTD